MAASAPRFVRATATNHRLRCLVPWFLTTRIKFIIIIVVSPWCACLFIEGKFKSPSFGLLLLLLPKQSPLRSCIFLPHHRRGLLLTSSIWGNWSSHRFFVMIVFIGISCARFMNNQRWTLFPSLCSSFGLLFLRHGLSQFHLVGGSKFHPHTAAAVTRQESGNSLGLLDYIIAFRLAFVSISTSAGCCRTFSNGF